MEEIKVLGGCEVLSVLRDKILLVFFSTSTCCIFHSGTLSHLFLNLLNINTNCKEFFFLKVYESASHPQMFGHLIAIGP